MKYFRFPYGKVWHRVVELSIYDDLYGEIHLKCGQKIKGNVNDKIFIKNELTKKDKKCKKCFDLKN